MSNNEPLLSKENWQTYIMNPGPSTFNLLTTPINSHKQRQISPAKPMKQTWTCVICKKDLSSKRSYTEHMNIHNKTRPFQCEHCTYAAASQMTLHRHKLRSHTPKTEWGYRCPYCDEAYMEPAGYQQHVQQRHPGLSATYGCPFGKCKFTSKSQRHFREHLVKHEKFEKVEGGVDPCILPNHELIRYMVSDDIGRGFKTITAAPVAIRAIPKATIAPKVYARPTGQTTTLNTGRSIGWQLEKVIVPNKAVVRTNHPMPRPSQTPRYYASSQNVMLSTPMMSSSEPNDNGYIHRFQHLLHPDYDIQDEEEEEERSDDYDGEMIEELDEEYREGDILEEYDEGPPTLESFEHIVPKTETRIAVNGWVKMEETQPEATSTEGLFLNGFIDEELD